MVGNLNGVLRKLNVDLLLSNLSLAHRNNCDAPQEEEEEEEARLPSIVSNLAIR